MNERDGYNRPGLNFGQPKICRVCQNNHFLVETGPGKLNDEAVTAMTIRCSRCGTVLEQLQIDWKHSVTPEDKVIIEDGIVRDTDVLTNKV